MINLLISLVLFIFGILIFTGILFTFKSDLDADSFGSMFLIGSLVFALLGVRKYGKGWTQRKRTIIQIVTFISIAFFFLLISSIITLTRSQKPQIEDISKILLKDNDLTTARNEFITGLNKTLAKVGEESNGFYSIVASYDDNKITFAYNIEVENNISINDGPIDALVKEAVKTYKENGTIKVLKDLKFKTLTMAFKGKSRVNARDIDLDKL